METDGVEPRLHEVGLEHKDLEPRNILESDDGTLRIIDFHNSEKHVCPGSEECEELRNFQEKLGLEF